MRIQLGVVIMNTYKRLDIILVFLFMCTIVLCSAVKSFSAEPLCYFVVIPDVNLEECNYSPCDGAVGGFFTICDGAVQNASMTLIVDKWSRTFSTEECYKVYVNFMPVTNEIAGQFECGTNTGDETYYAGIMAENFVYGGHYLAPSAPYYNDGSANEGVSRSKHTWFVIGGPTNQKNLGRPTGGVSKAIPGNQSPERKSSPALPAPCVGNPINPATGNKFQVENDYVGGLGTYLQFTRYYNSQDGDIHQLGIGWRSNYHRTLSKVSDDIIEVHLENGHLDIFKFATNVWLADSDTQRRLIQTATGWQITDDNDIKEEYNFKGQLTSLTYRGGLKTTLSYDANDKLIKVVGPFGHILLFSYNENGLIKEMTTPNNEIYTYSYNSQNVLAAVTFPDGNSRHYLYEDPRFQSAMTGIVDENGIRFASFSYDSFGRAVSSEHAVGIEKSTLYYNEDQSTSVTDSLGNTRNFIFTNFLGLVKPTQISNQDCSCGGSGYSYDANGFIASTTDSNGTVTTYTRDSRGLELSRTEAFGTSHARTVTTAWHSTFHLPVTITEPNRLTTFAYDNSGNLLTKTITAAGKTRSWSYTYNNLGQILSETDPLGNITTFTYNAQGALASVTNPLNQTTSITDYDGNGYPTRVVDPNGLVVTITYDLRSRLTSIVRGGETTTFTYDAAGQLTKTTFADGRFLVLAYDDAHRLTEIADALGNKVLYTLDAMSNVTKAEVFGNSNQLRMSRSFAYDQLNRLSKMLDVQGRSTTLSYDGNGNITGITDPLGRVTSNIFDPLNRIIQSIDPHGSSASIGYDSDDNPIAVTDQRGLATTYTYDGLGNFLTNQSPDAGTTTNTYDAAGNILTSTDARGIVATNTYDAVGRVLTTSYTGGTTESYQYDAGTYGKGRLTQITDSSGSISWIYDIMGRVVQKKQRTGSVTLSTAYEYQATTGRLLSITYPSGKKLIYTYDASGRTIGITHSGSALLSGINYQPFGPATGWIFGNGSTHTRTYNLDGQLSSITITGGDNAALSYSYDAAGRITQIDDNSVAPRIAPASSTHSYAATNNRLISTSGSETRSYTYDAMGNILTDGTRTFTYNVQGRMSQVVSGGVTTTYLLNGLGQRVKKSNPAGTTIFTYDEAGQLLGEYDATGAAIQETVWLGDMPVAILKGNARYYINPDHLGAPRSITDQTDKVVWRWAHDPYGNGQPITDGTTGLVCNLRFPGQYYDTESGLHYNYFRDYNPSVGRYVQSDPIGLNGGINTYVYVNGRPVAQYDYYGLASSDISSLVDKIGTVMDAFEAYKIVKYRGATNDPCNGLNNRWKGMLDVTTLWMCNSLNIRDILLKSSLDKNMDEECSVSNSEDEWNSGLYERSQKALREGTSNHMPIYDYVFKESEKKRLEKAIKDGDSFFPMPKL